MIAITYRITLREPLLATALAGEPNSSISLPFVPGSMIRGLLAGRYKSIHANEDLAMSARSLLFDGSTRYLNAYPADDQNRRCLPVPLSWRKEKTRTDAAGPVEDFALLSPDQSKFDAPKGLVGFISLGGDRFSIVSPRRQINVHTRRDRSAGRPTKTHGDVYRYEALAPGEVFIGAIIAPSREQAQRILGLLPEGDYRLGGSATGGYGSVRLDYPDGVRHATHDAWREYDSEAVSIAKNEQFVVTLLSDAILRGDDGVEHTDLGKALGLPVTNTGAFKTVTTVGGFNRHWGLPLPQVLALRAGSVFVLRALQEIASGQIEIVLNEGVGDRRVDGFGRIAVGWQQSSRLLQEVRLCPQPQMQPVTLPDSLRPLAQRMATRRRRLELDRRLITAINGLRRSTRNLPPNSQLSRVRVTARDALAKRELWRISDLFEPSVQNPGESEAANPHAMKEHALKRFEAARVDGQRLNSWIVDLADHPQSVWDHLGGGQAKPLAGVEPEGWLAEEYAVRLIDGVLGAAMATRRGGGDG